MIETLIDIFKLYGYEQNNGSELVLFKSKNIDDYWLIYPASPSTLNAELQSTLLHQCQEICNEPALEKNITMLCLWEVDNINKNTISQLHRLEEDIYFFKKHVLYYTKDEAENFERECLSNSLASMILDLPTKPDFFENYKSNLNLGLISWESLLYRICMKVSFIPIAKGESGEIDNLYKEHDLSLTHKPRLKKLDDIVHNLKNEQLLSEPAKLLSLITLGLENDRL
jgi:hypothetical protein